MRHSSTIAALLCLGVAAAQTCYYAEGQAGPSNLVPCSDEENAPCCLQGDTCLSGNTCFNEAYQNTYQYGCTDSTYTASTCPFKCGWNATLSPWVGLNYCDDLPNSNAWICESPESCGCEWQSSEQMLKLPPRDCTAMGYEARVALYASPSSIAPWLILPKTAGGTTLYFSGITVSGTSTWLTTPVAGYTPSPNAPLGAYSLLTTIAIVDVNAQPSPATLEAAHTLGTTPPLPNGPVSTPTGPGTGVPSTSSTPKSSTATSKTSTKSTTSQQPSSVPNTISSVPNTSTTNTAPSPTHTNNGGGGLSSGAKIGIGVGVGLGAAAIIAFLAAFFLLRRRKRSRGTEFSKASKPGDESSAANEKRAGATGNENEQWGFTPAAAYRGGAAEVHEAPLREAPRVELPSDAKPPPQPIYELEGDSSAVRRTPAPEYATLDKPSESSE